MAWWSETILVTLFQSGVFKHSLVSRSSRGRIVLSGGHSREMVKKWSGGHSKDKVKVWSGAHSRVKVKKEWSRG